MHSDNLEREIARVVQSVNEWDDRTSPEEYPDHLLITSEELADILRNFAGNVWATAAPNLPEDVVASLRAIGPVEWGRSFEQSDEKHASDFVDTLRITREHFGTEGETAIHGVYLAGTNTVLAHTGSSPNSPQHARILVGAWNHLVEQAIAASTSKGAFE